MVCLKFFLVVIGIAFGYHKNLWLVAEKYSMSLRTRI